MEFKMTLAWDEQCGLSASKMFPLIDGIQDIFKKRNYGLSIIQIWTVLTCRAWDLKQRKQFKKDLSRFEYEFILDFYLIKHSEMEQKKAIIRQQIIEITIHTFSKYKFQDFDKKAFITDLSEIVNTIDW